MEPQELFNKTGESLKLWQCSKCRLIYLHLKMCEECCVPNLCECGNKCERSWLICESCKLEKKVNDIKQKLDKAELVEDIGQPVSWDDECYESSDDLIDSLGLDQEFPLEVFACKEVHLKHLDANEIIEEFWSDLDEDTRVRGVSALQEHLDDFWEENKSCVRYEPDYARKIRILKPEED